MATSVLREIKLDARVEVMRPWILSGGQAVFVRILIWQIDFFILDQPGGMTCVGEIEMSETALRTLRVERMLLRSCRGALPGAPDGVLGRVFEYPARLDGWPELEQFIDSAVLLSRAGGFISEVEMRASSNTIHIHDMR